MDDICPVCDQPLGARDFAHTWHEDYCMQVQYSGLMAFVSCTCGGLRDCHDECCPTCALLDAAEDFDRVFGVL